MIEPPHVRRLFRPDKGYILFECDLARADAQVVAKESKDEPLLTAFRNNIDIYTEMAEWCYDRKPILPVQRQYCKNGTHAVDYACKANTLATTLHTPRKRAEEYIERWFTHHPGIRQWHRGVGEQLRRTRTVRNIYGFRKVYTDRLDNLLPQALAWIASSTVSVTINRGMRQVFGPPIFPGMTTMTHDPWTGERYAGIDGVELLLQVHDSFIGQVREKDADALLPFVLERSQVNIPYPTPLLIPVTMKVSAESWGDVQPWKPREPQDSLTSAAA